MFVLEVRSSASKGSINKGGHYQEELVDVEVHLKDQSRFATKWAFFRIRLFGTNSQAAAGRFKLPDVPFEERRRRPDVRAVLSDADTGGQGQGYIQAGGREIESRSGRSLTL